MYRPLPRPIRTDPLSLALAHDRKVQREIDREKQGRERETPEERRQKLRVIEGGAT